MSEEILFLTHKKHDKVIQEFNKLKIESSSRPVTALCHNVNLGLANEHQLIFNNSDLNSLYYSKIGKSIIPGHAHFPLFYFFLETELHSDYYWFIEYDVRYTGKWTSLFDAFKNVHDDFLAAHLKNYSEEPEWPWWELKHPVHKIDLQERWRSFNPIFRISRRALHFLHSELISGWKGHNEVILVTLLKNNGFSVRDFNNNVKLFGKSHKFYTNKSNTKGELIIGTHRYKHPMADAGYRKNLIYHPIKVDNGVKRLVWFIGNVFRIFKSKIHEIKKYLKSLKHLNLHIYKWFTCK